MLIQKVLHRANIRIKIGQIGAAITSKTIANPESIKQVQLIALVDCLSRKVAVR